MYIFFLFIYKKMSMLDDDDDDNVIYPSDMQPGSLMHSRKVTKNVQYIQDMIDTFKTDIEKEMKMQYRHIKAINYRSQVINGAIYHINVEATTAFIPIKQVPPQKFTVTIFHDMKTGKDSFSGISNVVH